MGAGSCGLELYCSIWRRRPHFGHKSSQQEPRQGGDREASATFSIDDRLTGWMTGGGAGARRRTEEWWKCKWIIYSYQTVLCGVELLWPSLLIWCGIKSMRRGRDNKRRSIKQQTLYIFGMNLSLISIVVGVQLFRNQSTTPKGNIHNTGVIIFKCVRTI